LVDLTEFENDRIAATSHFAQSMIVIDDEAFQDDRNNVIKHSVPLVTPGRGTKPAAKTAQTSENETLRSKSNLLDARTLIETSLGLGIVCSVLRAKKSPKLKKQVIRASRNADIVSLDWEIENDSGELATNIIEGIVRSDIKRNGRIRLISVYTSTRNRGKILERVRDGLNEKCKGKYAIEKDHIKSFIGDKATGLRIIVLFKIHGNRELRSDQMSYAVNEKKLPARLLQEFSKLSEGLLGNVAMATAGAIRDVTHHVLKTFDADTDGPYLHHRTLIPAPWEAKDYAIDLILSEIKKSVIRKDINSFTSDDAIKNYLRFRLNGESLKLAYQFKGKDKEMEFDSEQLASLIILGLEEYSNLGSQAKNFKKAKIPSGFPELFFSDQELGAENQLKFAAMSQMGLTPMGHRVQQGDIGAVLTTGTLVKSSKYGFLICVQAKCDTVRRKNPATFLFARMTEIEAMGKNAIFVIWEDRREEHIILEIDDDAYLNLLPIIFKPDNKSKEIEATTYQGCKGLNFKSKKGDYFRWMGNVKHKRALKAIGGLSQSMSRIGFDEFEPFRK